MVLKYLHLPATIGQHTTHCAKLALCRNTLDQGAACCCSIHLTVHQAQLRPDHGHRNAAPKVPGSKPHQAKQQCQQSELESADVPPSEETQPAMLVDAQVWKLCLHTLCAELHNQKAAMAMCSTIVLSEAQHASWMRHRPSDALQNLNLLAQQVSCSLHMKRVFDVQ